MAPHNLFLPAAVVMALGTSAQADVIHVTTRDSSGQPLPCRVVARDQQGRAIYPDTTSTTCYPHHGPLPYFVSEGEFDLADTGMVTLTFSRGPEYRSLTVNAAAGQTPALDLVLPRLTNMAQAGWHSGDGHVHLWHDEPNPLEPIDGVRLGRAEGLEFVAVLDEDRYFIGAPDPASTSDCLLYASMEYRSHVYGHIAMPGLVSLVTPYASGAPGDPAYPVNADMMAQAKAHGGLAVYAHPISDPDFWDTSAWPMTGIARELPADAALGMVDAVEVLSYSNDAPGAAIPIWYDLLNAGMRVPATAGTDAVLNRATAGPAGGYRVYVQTGSSEFVMKDWLEALRAGRSFVTAGPLITEFTADGQTIGGTVELPPGSTTLSGNVSFVSDGPLLDFDVIWNGAVAYHHALPYASSASATYAFAVSESGWLAVLVRSAPRTDVSATDAPFAHSSPIWVEADAPFRPRAAAVSRLVDWNENLRTLVRARGGFESAGDSLHVEEILTTGGNAIRAPFAEPPSAPLLVSPGPGATVHNVHPSLAWAASADPDPGDEIEYRVRLSPSPFSIQQSAPISTEETSLRVPETLESGTVYYWTVEARDAARDFVYSDVGSFLVDTTGTSGVAGPPPARWRAGPVPFHDSVTFSASASCHARVTIYDVAGQRVRVLEGKPPLTWDGRDESGRDAASGTYVALPGASPPIRVVRIR